MGACPHGKVNGVVSKDRDLALSLPPIEFQMKLGIHMLISLPRCASSYGGSPPGGRWPVTTVEGFASFLRLTDRQRSSAGLSRSLDPPLHAATRTVAVG